ncbi:hypothetical protein P171DRAFT_86579 [Karstenula rhodostoma CBS 690.94]|uniref:Uncharacterized protein n=1 Tax=Karstenula rhodostoma CBS 690.94 TaxID=1392251 RepID=A0A9P4U7A6_9PLEO|nr:hypothetical protein P171DRAFT_86579 [Karstenula rhodostoma CBS 690.94]
MAAARNLCSRPLARPRSAATRSRSITELIMVRLVAITGQGTPHLVHHKSDKASLRFNNILSYTLTIFGPQALDPTTSGLVVRPFSTTLIFILFDQHTNGITSSTPFLSRAQKHIALVACLPKHRQPQLLRRGPDGRHIAVNNTSWLRSRQPVLLDNDVHTTAQPRTLRIFTSLHIKEVRSPNRPAEEARLSKSSMGYNIPSRLSSMCSSDALHIHTISFPSDSGFVLDRATPLSATRSLRCYHRLADHLSTQKSYRRFGPWPLSASRYLRALSGKSATPSYPTH